MNKIERLRRSLIKMFGSLLAWNRCLGSLPREQQEPIASLIMDGQCSQCLSAGCRKYVEDIMHDSNSN
jgi:hypothetical protein